MTSTKSVYEQAEAYIYETLVQYSNDRKNHPDRFRWVESEEQAAANWVAKALFDAKLLRSENDTEKIAIAVAEALVAAGFKTGE